MTYSWQPEAWTQCLPSCRWHFEMHIPEKKCLLFYSNCSEVCSWGSNWHKVSTSSGNGLVPNRRQPVTLTNVDQDAWRDTVSLGHNDSGFFTFYHASKHQWYIAPANCCRSVSQHWPYMIITLLTMVKRIIKLSVNVKQGSHRQASENFNDFSMIFQDKNPKFSWWFSTLQNGKT